MTFEILNYLIEIASNSTQLPSEAQRKTHYDHSPPEDELSAFITALSSEKVDNDILSKTKYRLQLLSTAQKDDKKAEELLLANISPDKEAFPLIDFTEWPIVRYAVSGELQTVESEEYFNNISTAAAIIRSAIVDCERAKKAPTFSILEKVLALNSALPERYKAMANILY
ncbi:hypothetical protein [Kosakonia sp. R1.Fl]|uniref:hypothetical protein n=1 Tax=Kosakonia sp. R1.Fl TaxID=2928706 RepID=UPI00201D6705|nr:hypothetical protein [Kosakonia sp. R1.Fl]MCL6745030.1 hypothetical protein [Kosakonia sp. R1.Fl]